MTKSAGLVLSSVQRGISDEKAIATWAALTLADVRAYLRELSELGLVKKSGDGWLAIVAKRA